MVLCCEKANQKKHNTWPNKDSESGVEQQHLPGRGVWGREGGKDSRGDTGIAGDYPGLSLWSDAPELVTCSLNWLKRITSRLLCFFFCLWISSRPRIIPTSSVSRRAAESTVKMLEKVTDREGDNCYSTDALIWPRRTGCQRWAGAGATYAGFKNRFPRHYSLSIWTPVWFRLVSEHQQGRK